MISIINYGAGNIASVNNVILSLKYPVAIVNSYKDISSDTTSIILPGVGDGAYMMKQLHERGFVPYLQQWIKNDSPLLGICVGAQVLLSFTEEGKSLCLDAIPGSCKSFQKNIDRTQANNNQIKIPHMGWNEVVQQASNQHDNSKNTCPLFSGIPNRTTFYFVHSYYLSVIDSMHTLATTKYGLEFSSIIGKGKIIGTQFHPEKSGKWGILLIDNFLKYYSGEQTLC